MQRPGYFVSVEITYQPKCGMPVEIYENQQVLLVCLMIIIQHTTTSELRTMHKCY